MNRKPTAEETKAAFYAELAKMGVSPMDKVTPDSWGAVKIVFKKFGIPSSRIPANANILATATRKNTMLNQLKRIRSVQHGGIIENIWGAVESVVESVGGWDMVVTYVTAASGLVLGIVAKTIFNTGQRQNRVRNLEIHGRRQGFAQGHREGREERERARAAGQGQGAPEAGLAQMANRFLAQWRQPTAAAAAAAQGANHRAVVESHNEDPRELELEDPRGEELMNDDPQSGSRKKRRNRKSRTRRVRN